MGRVEHHFDDTVHIVVDERECTDVHAEASRQRGTHLFRVEQFAFDFA